MPLRAYMSVKDPKKISSVNGHRDGGREYSKKIQRLYEPYRLGSKGPLNVLYADECQAHPPGEMSAVPMEAYVLEPKVGWSKIGTIKACPICWQVLRWIDDSPVGVIIPPDNSVGRMFGSRLEEPGKPKAERKVTKPSVQENLAWKAATELMMTGEPFSVPDIISLGRCSRDQARKWVERFLQTGKIELVTSGGGRGKRSFYQKKAP
jgi:hypothetical protein